MHSLLNICYSLPLQRRIFTTLGTASCLSSAATITRKMSTEAYESGSTSVAYVTTPDEASAKKIARALVDRKLAACVNILPNITSIYSWDGKVNEDNEYLMMIKTRTSRVDDLAKFVRENHPYSVAEVISLPIENGNMPYLSWIMQSVPKN